MLTYIAVLATGVVLMHLLCKLDLHLVRRRKVQEIDEAGAAFRHRQAEQHRELMLRLGMNPGYARYAQCSPSRILTTFGRERELGLHNTALSDLMPPAPVAYTPEEAQQRMMNRMAENVQTQLDNMINNHNEAIKKLSKRTGIPIPDWEDVPVKTPDDEPIPAPDLFTKEEADAV